MPSHTLINVSASLFTSNYLQTSKSWTASLKACTRFSEAGWIESLVKYKTLEGQTGKCRSLQGAETADARNHCMKIVFLKEQERKEKPG